MHGLLLIISMLIMGLSHGPAEAAYGDPIRAVDVSVDMDNHSALASKMEAIRKATQTIDIATYLFGEDFTNSYLMEELLVKANQNVKIRILVDGAMATNHTALFSGLVRLGKGNIEVAYYRPIPKEVFEDLKSWGVDDASTLLPLLAGGTEEARNAFLATNPKLIPVMQALQENPLTALVTLKKELAKNGATLRVPAWIEATKFLHHKLLVVDGKFVQGGGRNLEDSYHMRPTSELYQADSAEKKAQGKRAKYLFIDTDFYFENELLAKQATETFNSYWNCIGKNGRCAPANLNVVREEGKQKTEEALHDSIMALSTRFTTQVLKEPLVATPKHVFKSATVQYLENRMFVPDPNSRFLLREEKSLFHEEWIRQIQKSAEAKEDIFVHSAYFLLPSGVLSALAQAMRKGSQVVFLTNSPVTSDLGYIAKAARIQYRSLLKLARELDPQNDARRLLVLEYSTNESLHAKVTVFGKRAVLVSSVNADPRCEFLDTGNGVLIQAYDPTEVTKFRNDLFDTGTLREGAEAGSQKVHRVKLDEVEAAIQASVNGIEDAKKRAAFEQALGKLQDLTDSVVFQGSTTSGKSLDMLFLEL